jgi:hypothetical protein
LHHLCLIVASKEIHLWKLAVRKCALSLVWFVKQITDNSFAGLGLICAYRHTI